MQDLTFTEITSVSGGLSDAHRSYLITLGSLGITNLAIQGVLFAAGGPPAGFAGVLITHFVVPAVNLAATAASYEASDRFIEKKAA